jgi:hypothetical protein
VSRRRTSVDEVRFPLSAYSLLNEGAAGAVAGDKAEGDEEGVEGTEYWLSVTDRWNDEEEGLHDPNNKPLVYPSIPTLSSRPFLSSNPIHPPELLTLLTLQYDPSHLHEYNRPVHQHQRLETDENSVFGVTVRMAGFRDGLDDRDLGHEETEHESDVDDYIGEREVNAKVDGNGEAAGGEEEDDYAESNLRCDEGGSVGRVSERGEGHGE